MLTNAARPRPSAYKRGDEQGLFLHVVPTGTRSFRRIRLGGREQLLTLDCWPKISLAGARARPDAAREQLGRGEDPRAPVEALTFEIIARGWHTHNVARWSSWHAGDVLASLASAVLPAIGGMPIGAITTPVLLIALRSIEGRGSIESARRVGQRVSDVFAFAISEARGPARSRHDRRARWHGLAPSAGSRRC